MTNVFIGWAGRPISDVAQALEEARHSPGLSDLLDDILRDCRPAIIQVAAAECAKHHLRWQNIGGDLLTEGLWEVRAFLGKLLAGFTPTTPTAKLWAVCAQGVGVMIRRWLNANRWQNPGVKGANITWRRHSQALAMHDRWERETGGLGDDADFLAWANPQTRTRLTSADLTPPTRRADLGDPDRDSLTSQTWESGDYEHILRQAAATALARIGTLDEDAQMAARVLLGPALQGDDQPLGGSREISRALPHQPTAWCAATATMVAAQFRQCIHEEFHAV